MADVVSQPLRALVEANRDDIKATVARHRGTDVAIFGSVARGAETPDSDVDFLVRFSPEASLFDEMHLEDELAELLGRPVDVVSVGGLKARDHPIRRDAIWL
jgi:uncharacterized protein